MRRFLQPVAMLLLLSLAIPGFSQGGFFATVTGTVTDSSKALIPGVTVKATAVDTNVVTTAVTNEAGVYNFSNLLPGKYTITASLPGFQTKNVTDAQLSQNQAYRYNFELTVSGVSTQVEVSVSADTILATSGATIGQALSQNRVQELPNVGNNVLDLITVMAGVENVVPTNPPSAANAFGREATTFAGVSAQNIPIVRDGIQVQDNRNPNGIYSVTTINPDLVGEIRLILAPVDAELGRGNGAISYSTRSGTNKYNGTAVWSFRNTALDPNTWTNNRAQNIPPGSPAGTLGTATLPNWSNVHQGTVSFGGPIIRNKTFFFALYDMNLVNQRTSTNLLVPTACARLGIFRYFNNWNNGNIFTGVSTTNATNATKPTVTIDGTPFNGPAGTVPANARPDGTTAGYDASLQSISVFGPLQSRPTAADCSDAPVNTTTLVPNGVSLTAAPGAGGSWDPYRRQLDPTGFIARQMAFYPLPNNYEIGDGLNTAGYRVLKHFTGTDNLFGSGEATGRRKQINVKIDHNFSASHKANVNVTYERVDSDDVFAGIPGMFSNKNFRRPVVVSSGFTSTLSSTMLNEARFGMRRNGVNVVAPWDRPEYQDELNAFFPADASGFRVIPQITLQAGAQAFCYPHSGARPPGGCGGGNLTATSIEKTPTFTYADTLSWTRGAHSFKFGGELRLNSSEARTSAANFFGNPTYAKPVGGSITGTGQGTGANDIGANNTAGGMAGMLANNATLARSFANFYAGSLSNLTALYFLTNPNDTSEWSDYRDQQLLVTKLMQNEFSAFAKDDFKLTSNLTLNLGVRWDYYGVPYVDSGLTIAAVGGGASAFGYSGTDFTGWMNPGQRGAVTSFEFVGPNSPNPGKTVYPNDYNNFGPAIGFAWNLPYFGEGKTTVRGGYQVTFQGGGRFGALQGPLAAPPGSSLDPATPNWQNVYRDLTSVASSLPIAPSVLPMQPIPLDRRTQAFTAFDPNYVSPYVQNLTLSVTRSVSRDVTVDVRYVGTVSRKNYTTLNLNTNNFLYNGLLEDLSRVRTGTEITKTASDPKSLLDRIFAGVNMCSTGCAALPAGQSFGAIGTTTGTGANAVYQTAALHLRSNNAQSANIANANFNAVAGFISSANGNLAVPAGTVGGALRANGFPENFVVTNPQFSAMNYFNNSGYSNYHSLQFQTSIRPIHGFSGQATYTWSKNLGLLGGLTDPTNRAQDYTNINNNPGHTLRMNGTFELPIGPNKLFMGNSSGWLARAVERWNLGLIYNLNGGAPTSITATTMLYGNGVPDIVYPVDLNDLKGVRWGIQQGVNLEGRYFDNNDMFVKVDDPQCATVTSLQNLNNVVGGVQTRCTLDALAMAVPAGTAGAIDRVFADGATRPSVIVLQHAQPGKKGNLGNNTIIGLGNYRFDASLGKTFQIGESKSVRVNIESQNVLNHPQPGNPNLSITGNDYFGRIDNKSNSRLLQGQLRFTF